MNNLSDKVIYSWWSIRFRLMECCFYQKEFPTPKHLLPVLDITDAV